MPKEKQTNCIIDCSVSDEIQLKGGSLEDQEVVGRRLAERNGWNVIRVFRKPHSATTFHRDDLEEIRKFIKTSEIPIHKYIMKCIDRFTRAGYPEYSRLKNELEALGVEVVDTYGIIQPKKNTLEHLGGFEYPWSVYSPSEASEMMAAFGGKQEGRDILTRLVGAEIRLVQEGYAVRRAPDGMVNKKVFIGSKERCIRIPDPERAQFFKKMFELRAEGKDDDKIVKHLNAGGFRTKIYRNWDRSDKENPRIAGKKGGIPLTIKQLQRYIQQTEYAGAICEKWTKYQPVRTQQFEGLVSIETFNRANRGKVYIKENSDGSLQLRYNYSQYGKVVNRRLKNNPDFAFKFIPCSTCHKQILGSYSRGKLGTRYAAYHCGGTPSRPHKYVRIPKSDFEKTVETFVRSLKFDKTFLNSFELVLNDTYRKREAEVVSQSSAVSHNVGNLKAQQASALEALTNTQSPVACKKLEERIEELEAQIQTAQEHRAEIEITERDIKSFVRYVKTVMEHPSEILIDTEDMRAQRTLFGLVFEEIPTYQEILNGTPKLSLVFKLSEEFQVNKDHLVTPTGIEPVFVP